ncbi:MAG TPA: Crp/Fnr family transcriptional regulator [Candidatus Saccharimonadales bacterium]|nr:Crp/Fnr family transcriptional regulator [Candidatus Saccharimonadales bacterium]
MDEMPPALKNLLEDARLKHVQKGQILFYLGDEPTEAYALKEGVVKVHNIDDVGNEKVLHLLKPLAVFPFAVFSGADAHTKWFYTALTDCDLYVVPAKLMLQTMRDDGDSAVYLMNWFSMEVHELLVRLDSLGKSNVRDKLIAALKYLAVCHGVERRSGWRRIPFSVNHQLIADMIGVTRESAAMAMKEMADNKIIRNPRLTILEIQLDKLVDEKQ